MTYELPITENVILADYTTLGIGGPAGSLVAVQSEEELRMELMRAANDEQPVLVLGGGSNMLISDAGWPGTVIRVAMGGVEFTDHLDGIVRTIAGGGVEWDAFVAQCVGRGLQGVECLSGIPGTVGASPIQNIGAYGQEVMETIAWVEAMDRATGEVTRFANEECGFSYRWSRFKGEDRDRYVVTKVAFDLKRDGKPSVRYGDLTRYFEEHGIGDPTLEQVRDAVISVRRSKGMVVEPGVADSRSCGSFFMNPIVTEDKAGQVRETAMREGLLKDGERMPEYGAGPGMVKLSAAWLMERSGLRRGEALGNVGLSSRHVLAVINRGGGTAEEVLKMVAHVQGAVRTKFDVELHPEPVFIGFEGLSAAGTD